MNTRLCLLPILAALAWTNPALAAQGGLVLQSYTQILGQGTPGEKPRLAEPAPDPRRKEPEKRESTPEIRETPSEAPPEKRPEARNSDAQALFEESLRQMMPLDEGQIQEYRERSDQRERALLPASPALSSRTARVTLEPGAKPVLVKTTANVATSLVFHDSTGKPWPITSVTNGGPGFFQVLRPELPDGNLLNVMPIRGYGMSTIVVTLEKRDVPLVIRLESDSVRSPAREADALVLFQLAHYGPKAEAPIIEDIKETASSDMLAFLDRVPPAQAVRLALEPAPEKLNVWRLGDSHYIRTAHTLVWPAWKAVVNGAGSVRCYEAPVTPRIMISSGGKIQTVLLKTRSGGRP
ncbi:MAG: DotH/IcmK family type IV secretion protein [Deltaproteobacteria bacterium]|jgi:intracellular multiplication protein IcmK|nr:DotH/IcmK family type IV secretion protein [Deltaproteobacteria bacterium]